jgi:hypothetical protein
LEQTRQIRDLLTAPLEDFDLFVFGKTDRLATGEMFCDLIHSHTRVPKELEDDKEDRFKVNL